MALALIGATAAQATPTPVQVTTTVTFNDMGYPAVGSQLVLDFLFDSDKLDEDPAAGSYLATDHGSLDTGLVIPGSVHELRALNSLEISAGDSIDLWALSGTADVITQGTLPFNLAIIGLGLTPDQILPDFTSLSGGALNVDLAAGGAGFGTRLTAAVVAVDIIREPSTAVEIDIKPGSCPNSWNRKSNGVLPVAMLGTEDFDVTHIDVATVTISRADGTGGSVGPNEGPPGPHSVFEDVGTPLEGEECDCHEAEGDGILDLSMKFRTQDVADLLPVDDPAGALVPLVVSGTLLDGTEFTSRSDCVRLVPPGSPPTQVTVQSIAGGWIDATPLDNNLDEGGFGSFERSYPHTTVLTLTAPSGHNGNKFVGWKLDEGELVQAEAITLVVNNSEHTAEAVFKKAGNCGLGVELAFLVPPLLWLRQRRRRRIT
jgi:hypothetical protein